LVQDVKDNPKSFYIYVRSRTKSKDKVGSLKDSAGNVINDDKGMCDNSTQLNSAGHVTLTANVTKKGKKSKSL